MKLIGRLAVDVRLKGKGCVECLLTDALHLSLAHSVEIATMDMVVDATDETTAAFCRHFDFESLRTSARRLQLPMETVLALQG